MMRVRHIIATFSLALALIMPCSAYSGTATGDLLSVPQGFSLQKIERMKGFNFICWWHDCYSDQDGIRRSLEMMRSDGATWVAVIPNWYQQEINSSIVLSDKNKTAPIEDIRLVIETAKAMGFKVFIKPHVSVIGSGSRTSINPENFSLWSKSYRYFILTYASLAQATSSDMLAIGTELEEITRDNLKLKFWVQLIQDVRMRYNGKLTYAANHSEYTHVKFWNLLDYIGIDAYFPVSECSGGGDEDSETGEAAEPQAPALEEMLACWTGIRSNLREVYSRFRRPIIFTEIGYRSVRGSTIRPWEYNESAGEGIVEQARAYEAALRSVHTDGMIHGVFWWFWDPQLGTEHASESEYHITGKPAEDVLRSFWVDNSSW